jgi:hypothetical protein
MKHAAGANSPSGCGALLDVGVLIQGVLKE